MPTLVLLEVPPPAGPSPWNETNPSLSLVLRRPTPTRNDLLNVCITSPSIKTASLDVADSKDGRNAGRVAVAIMVQLYYYKFMGGWAMVVGGCVDG